jgi:hypothetical protein
MDKEILYKAEAKYPHKCRSKICAQIAEVKYPQKSRSKISTEMEQV